LVGLKAAETILQHLRLAGKNALFSTYGEEARIIISRAAAPGLTMTSEGYYVPGVLENRSRDQTLLIFFSSHCRHSVVRQIL
jgi:hypothetical protein